VLTDPADLATEDLAAASPPAAAAPPPLPEPPLPTQPPQVDEDGIADFSTPQRRVRFRIDEDVFEGPRELPAEAALRFIAKAESWRSTPIDQAPQLLPQLFAEVLLPESLKRFLARLGDQQRPISLPQIQRAVLWMFEQYGMRPTPGLSGSSPGSDSPDGGTSSTAPPPPAASTPPGSPSTAG
jgi:hypothetical protein